jgi:EF hand
MMSIVPVGNALSGSLFASADSTSARRGVGPVEGAPASAADTVTLSLEAQAIASLNAKGITVTFIHSPGLSSGRQPASAAPVANGSVSKSDFEGVVAGFGVGAEQADQAFAAIDSNGTGSISNSEMLGAMSATSQGGGALSQNLRQMMDANQDGTVSGTEFINLETALVRTEA